MNKEIIDFIEIILLSDFTLEEIEIIKNLKMPYVIHIPSSNYGIDFGKKTNDSQNLNYIKKINLYRKNLNPICYIIHPESGDINFSIKNIKRLKIKPIALENMPIKSLIEGELLGFDPTDLKKYFCKIKNLEFCLDINHAIKAAISKKVDYIQFIKELLALKKPIIFHISGGNFHTEVDEHLPLDESNYDIIEIKKVLTNLDYFVNLTFETPRNYKKKIIDDLKNMKFFIDS
ncbi:MAG: hypothetical protein ACFFDH_05505 [Promethearchaeota archaeon]